MNPLISMADVRGARLAAGEEVAGLLIGTGFTFALFFGLAHFENFGTTPPITEIEDVRMAALPLEPPPPPPKLEELAPVPDEALPFAGLEIGASDSPVSIAVVPPDLEVMLPATTSLPRAKIQVGFLHSELKPKAGLEVDLRHVYQSTEVDQKPHAIVRTVPIIPSEVSGSASTLRVGLLLLLDVNGHPESVRVAESSGNPRFDTIVANTVKDEWMFSAATRRGRKVRVLAQQSFRINFSSGGSPFELSP